MCILVYYWKVWAILTALVITYFYTKLFSALLLHVEF